MPGQTVVQAVKEQQLSWANRAGIRSDEDGYCYVLNENLFRPLSSSSRIDLAGGDGAELGRQGKRGKILALHSSAALACNFFDYWRGRDMAALADTFGTKRLSDIVFERKFPTGLRGRAPNLDVVLHESGGSILAIESKFMEPFQRSRTKTYLKPKYFEDGGAWARVGLHGCQALAERIRDDEAHFELLDVAQLLKHMLGLASNLEDWRLLYLWYDPEGPAGERHSSEIGSFREAIGCDARRFLSMTYQEAFLRMSHFLGQQHLEYQVYLRERYFRSIP